MRSNGGEDDVGGVALAAHEVAMAEVLISLHVANDGFDGRVRRRSRLMMPKTPRFRPEMKTRRKARCRYNVTAPLQQI